LAKRETTGWKEKGESSLFRDGEGEGGEQFPKQKRRIILKEKERTFHEINQKKNKREEG